MSERGRNLKIKIIDFKDKYEKNVLDLFYRSVFYNRKEFEYARLPSWNHRYALEGNSKISIASIDSRIVGSLGLIPYWGYVQKKKSKIGFFVDNCVDPDFYYDYNEIMEKLFTSIEEKAIKDNVEYIIGWDYTSKAERHKELFEKLGYQRVDGINWIGGGTKPVSTFCTEGFYLSPIWRVLLKILNFEYYFYERRLKPLRNITIRTMAESDLPKIVELINTQNENLEFSPRYTTESLKEVIKKYHADILVAEKENNVIGVGIFFVATWSGWMYGKPHYSKSYCFFLIKHLLEFAIDSKFCEEEIASYILSKAMKDKKNKGYVMLVDVIDRRVSWKKKAFLDVGANELPYDYGTLFLKNLSGETIDLSRPIYIPTNLVISPYTGKI